MKIRSKLTDNLVDLLSVVKLFSTVLQLVNM